MRRVGATCSSAKMERADLYSYRTFACDRSFLSVRIYNRFGRGGGRQGGAKADVSTSASLAFAKLIVAAQLIRPAEKVPVVKEPLPGGDNDRFAKIFERLAKLPAGHKPRAGDFASAVWEFGREALVKLEEQKRTEIVFGDKPLTHLPRNDIPSGILSSNVTFLRATYFVPAVCDDRANQFFEKPCIRPMRPENARIRLPAGLASPELGCTGSCPYRAGL